MLGIHRLDLAFKLIDYDKLKILVQELKKDKKVYFLDLSGNKFGDKGCELISELFRANNNLISIKLCDNKISDEGVKHLCKGLKENCTIHQLALGDNRITDEGVKYLCEVLILNTELIDVDLCANAITDVGAQHLLQALQKNSVLEHLGLRNNEINNQKYIEEIEAKFVENNQSNNECEDMENIDESNNDNQSEREEDEYNNLLQAEADLSALSTPSKPYLHRKKSQKLVRNDVTKVKQSEELLKLQKEIDDLKERISNLSTQVVILWKFAICAIIIFVLTLVFILSALIGSVILATGIALIYYLTSIKRVDLFSFMSNTA